MANSGFIIHPFVQQVFNSGPDSGSAVSSSFSTTFSGSYSSSLLCDNTFVYREQDLENCPVVGECPIPVFSSVSVSDCNDKNSRDYTLFVNLSTEATTLFVDYSTSSTFSSNIKTFSKSATTNSTFSINVSDLVVLPINKQTPIYFRCRFDCGGGNISVNSITRSAVCPPPIIADAPSYIQTNSVTSTFCNSCASITVNIPRNNSRTVTITKSGIAGYASGFCPGVNQISSNISETITTSKTYTIGLDASNGSTNLLSSITIQVKDGNSIEDTYVLQRTHSNIIC